MLLISYECLSRNLVFKIRWDHNNIKEKNPFLLSYVFLSQHVCDTCSFLKTNSRNAFCDRYTATVAGSSCIYYYWYQRGYLRIIIIDSAHCAGNVNITHIFSFYLNLFKHLISPGKYAFLFPFYRWGSQGPIFSRGNAKTPFVQGNTYLLSNKTQVCLISRESHSCVFYFPATVPPRQGSKPWRGTSLLSRTDDVTRFT